MTDILREVRIAAVGDLHVGRNARGLYRGGLSRVNHEADVLALCGDLTNFGTPEEAEVLLGELAEVNIPIVAVLGNHDHEAGLHEQFSHILCERGIHLLDDGDSFEFNEWLGFAGVKGFCGGYGPGALSAFGESMIKTFVKEALDEAAKLEVALRKLATPVRIALLHYAPVADTVRGEPIEIYPYLGTSRLAQPLDNFQVAACFHGHAHHGSFAGRTTGGVPVFNVALPLLRQRNPDAFFHVHTVTMPTEMGRAFGTPERRRSVSTGASGRRMAGVPESGAAGGERDGQ
ncbi:MAG: metallophosphoesterase family protein [Pseudomonadota bacterium]